MTRWTLCTPSAPGALAIIELTNPAPASLDQALAGLGLPPCAQGRLCLADLLGVDRGILARPSRAVAQLIPHGGPAIIRALADALAAAGIAHEPAPDPLALYPEAASPIEAQMLAALARAPSRAAIDLLLAQPARWAQPAATSDPALDRLRQRLIDPPLVALVGRANIGKSTLLNALAGASVAAVADAPGTTRDHVGVLVDLAGLTARVIDTPGIRSDADALEQAAAKLATPLIEAADLVLVCCDAASSGPESMVPQPSLVVALRHDLGVPAYPHDAAVGQLHTPDPSGLGALIGLIREQLVPAAALADPGPWRFWARPDASETTGRDA